MDKKKSTNKYLKEERKCTSCGLCTSNCDFLKKYNLDFSNYEALSDLAYHCFLCGKCTDVCPEGIDGRAIILELRKEKVKTQGGKVVGYGMLKLEKGNYLFKNYSHGKKKSVLFPGCNFPSFYPETMKTLMRICKEKGIGVVFDCCGKPISELGLEKKEKNIILDLNQHFKENGIEEVIMVCPNCYYFLKDQLEVNVISIYEKLHELGLGEKIEDEHMKVFLPCPDRNKREWIHFMEDYLPEDVSYVESVPCCGEGGCAGKNEANIVAGFIERVKKETDGAFYVYCGTCAGNFTRKGAGEVHHILTDVLGVHEIPDVKHSLKNRIKTKFI